MKCRYSVDSIFQALENRNLFSVPAVTDFRADHQSAPIGVPITLTTTGIAQAGIRAATFWLDLDGNSRWTPGVDATLGDTWTNSGAQQASLSRTVLPTSAWPQNVRLMTNLQDTQGRWGTTPRLLQLQRTSRPQAAIINASSSIVTPDDPITLTVTGLGSTQLFAASFFADMNDNHVWDIGVDQPIGDTWIRVPNTNAFRLTTTLGWAIAQGFESPDALGVQTRTIGANVVDVNGAWSSTAATMTIAIAPRANVVVFSATGSATSVQLTAVVQQWAASGWAVVLPGAPNAVTHSVFFYDANRSERYDSGDVILGTVNANPAMGSMGGTFTLNATAQASWPWPRQYGAYAVDARTSGDPRSPARIAVQPGDSSSATNVLPWVTRVRQAPSGTPRTELWVIEGEAFTIETTISSAVGSPIGLSAAILFYDVDRDGQYNMAYDRLIEQRSLTSGLGTQQPTFNFPIAGSGQIHIAAAGIDANGRIGAARSTVVVVTQRPNVNLLSTQMVTENGARFLEVVLDAISPAGIRSVTGILEIRDNTEYYPVIGNMRNGHWVVRIPTAGLPLGNTALTLRIATFYNVETIINTFAVIT